MGEEATTFTRKRGPGEERGTNSPRAAELERRGGGNQLWEVGAGSAGDGDMRDL